MRHILLISLSSLLGLDPIVSFAQTERQVSVTHFTAYEENGYIKVLGEVKNTYNNPLASIRIEIEYFDKSGKPLGVDRFTAREAGTMAKDEVLASRDVIPPGETSPFERVRDVGKLKGQFGSCKVKASGLLLRENNRNASIQNLDIKKEGKGYRINGVFRATGKEACPNPKVIAVGYDQGGKVQEIATFSLTDDGTFRGKPISKLSPGQSQRFNMLLSNQSGRVSSVKVFTSYDWF